jgi:hypothetical protein
LEKQLKISKALTRKGLVGIMEQVQRKAWKNVSDAFRIGVITCSALQPPIIPVLWLSV